MKRALLAGAGLLALLACERPAAREQVYAPHEEGLTLAFENPGLPSDAARNNRLQVRVRSVAALSGGGRLVEEVFTTYQSESSARFLLRGGGVTQVEGEKALAVLLPEGFPDRTPSWLLRGRRYRVLGRALSTFLGPAVLPGEAREGIWVESEAVEGTGPRLRAFYLPDLGEVETLEWRPSAGQGGGSWSVVNRLVDRQFTDAPLLRRRH